MTIVVDVVAVLVENVASVLAGVVRVSGLMTVGRLSSPYSGPCFLCRPCIMQSDLGVTHGFWRLLLVVRILPRRLMGL